MRKVGWLGVLCLAPQLVLANTNITVDMYQATLEGQGEKLGTVKIHDTDHGVVFTPKLTGLAPGIHGFHLHANASCEPGEKDGKKAPAVAAGGHFDPENTGKHDAPWGDGHLGDLPSLYVTEKGEASQPVLAPRLEMSDLKQHALMVHEGGDNFADEPKPLGGGGARIACGVITK